MANKFFLRKKISNFKISRLDDGADYTGVEQYNSHKNLFRGKTDRHSNYKNYEQMDEDSDISRALDIIAEHITEVNEKDLVFRFLWFDTDLDNDHMDLISTYLQTWHYSNALDKRAYEIIRNVLKYGDWFLFRDPDTFEYYHIHPKNVIGAEVDMTNMEVISWNVRNFRFNINDNTTLAVSTGDAGTAQGVSIPAEHIVHFSLNNGKVAAGMNLGGNSMNNPYGDQQTSNWPFGSSWLDRIHKTFKSREALEAAVVIHRMQRAPSRLAWFIDVGRTRNDKTATILQRFRNELHQKRMSAQAGDGTDIADSVYNPLSSLEDYYIPVSAEQRGSKVEVLEGTPWTDLPDLEYFNKKMASALRVPYAWLQPNGNQIIPSNGREGVATVEEVEFSRFCSRVQLYFNEVWDKEFKKYLFYRGFSEFDPDSFVIKLNPPDDYMRSKKREIMKDSVDVARSMLDLGIISKRVVLKSALGWSEDMIAENEEMILIENVGSKYGEDDSVVDDSIDRFSDLKGEAPGLDNNVMGTIDFEDDSFQGDRFDLDAETFDTEIEPEPEDGEEL